MARVAAIVLLLTVVSCVDDSTVLRRGALGPASYRVTFDVDGDPALATDALEARLSVRRRPGGATLDLSVGDEDPITAELRRLAGGRLELETVQGVPPGTAGEADLASLVEQLDPPLVTRPVRLGDAWSRSRTIATESLGADLRTRLRVVRFDRQHGMDVAELRGSLRGTLRTLSADGTEVTGAIRGTTRLSWALTTGRLASSDARLVWSIEGAGDVVLRTSVRPLQG